MPLGSLICLFSINFPMILIGRFIQGFGASAPRIVSIAMVRDGQAGAAMARVMSFVMMVFMLVPMLAPSIGTLVLLFAELARHLRGLPRGAASSPGCGCGSARRKRCRASGARRSPSSSLLSAAGRCCAIPSPWATRWRAGSIFGAFIVYLGTSQQIFAEQYGQGAYFALWFAFFAGGMAIAMMVNARLVMRLGHAEAVEMRAARLPGAVGHRSWW